MPKKRPQRPRDVNELAAHIGKLATHEIEEQEAPEPDQRAVKGGLARAAKLSREKRLAIARKGGKASAKARKRR